MKRILAALLCAASVLISAGTLRAQIRDIDITVTLAEDGSALIREVWDVTVTKGTEWYLVRENLGDIEVGDLAVSDETGRQYQNEGRWNVDRSISEKAGRCGIVRKSNGCEICWGVGSYADHVFDVSYKMTNVVKSANDMDYFHMQFVSDELSSAPNHVKVTISKPGSPMDSTWCGIWGFGFDGEVYFKDGCMVSESLSAFDYGSSVILLGRFDKGVFNSPSVQECDFQEVLDRAFEGSGYLDIDEDEKIDKIANALTSIFAIGVLLAPFIAIFAAVRKKNKKMMNAVGARKLTQVPWSRTIPYGGDLSMSYYVMTNTLGMLDTSSSSIASSMILKMIYGGFIDVTKTPSEKVRLSFNDKADLNKLNGVEAELYRMMYESSGDDHILVDREFSRWASKNKSRLIKWTESVSSRATDCLKKGGYINGSKYTETGCQENRNIVGFKKYLEDTTLLKQRSSEEVHLWREYMVFASLFGIASKVAKQLKDVDPIAFEKMTNVQYNDFTYVMSMTNSLTRTIANSGRTYSSSSSSYGGYSTGSSHSRSGWGGHTSFGGGGGFSGGGHGGGSR